MVASYLIGIGCSFLLAAVVATLWVRGIDFMKENHPDYKGDDFLNWGESEIKDLDGKE